MSRILLILSLALNLGLIAGCFYVVQSLGGFQYMWFKMKNRGVSGVYAHRANLFETMPAKDSTIVFLGNSITEQCEWRELLDNPKIVNRGISGDMTKGVLNRLETITSQHPQKLFLMIGINDLLFHDADYVIENYRQIVQNIQVQSPETEIILQSILPVNNQVRQIGISNDTIKKVNKAIQSMAEEFSLRYLNIHQLLTDTKGNLDAQYTVDGIHINGKAYMVWKEALVAFL